MTSLIRLLAIATIASFSLTGIAAAQSPTGATNAKDAMMEKDAMKKNASNHGQMKKDEMMEKNDMKKDMKHDDMKDDTKKDAMMKKDTMKK